MKTAVIYHSNTGFTKRYAQWVAQASGADCYELSEAKKKNLTAYEAIIFGGWACAGGISKLKWFTAHMDMWQDKRLIVFCVGASPADSAEVEAALSQNFNEAKLKKANLFYCPGGLNYEKMPAPSKLMMKFFIKMLKAKKDKTKDDEIKISMLSSSYDISDKKYIVPILNCLNGSCPATDTL